MTRAEVEAIFPAEDGGLQAVGTTRYYEEPEIKIEIGFDQTGGAWRPQNRVTALPRVYRELGFAD
jgi:hypothetical protein